MSTVGRRRLVDTTRVTVRGTVVRAQHRTTRAGRGWSVLTVRTLAGPLVHVEVWPAAFATIGAVQPGQHIDRQARTDLRGRRPVLAIWGR